MIPIGFREIPAEGLDKDFVFVELEHDVGKPPMLFTLHAVAVARRAPRGWRGLEGFLDHIGNWDARWECKATSYSNQAVSQGALAAETRRSQANCVYTHQRICGWSGFQSGSCCLCHLGASG